MASLTQGKWVWVFQGDGEDGEAHAAVAKEESDTTED